MNKVQLLELLPHREPMLLLDELVHVDALSGSALVHVAENSTFCIPGKGVPSWVGLEYMGQTAALIGGYQQQSGNLDNHTGFLLGSRQFKTTVSRFTIGTTLRIHCTQSALVGATLATFTAEIHLHQSSNISPVATAVLSVFRQPVSHGKKPESST
ncbi:MAG: hypothetical protein AB8B64_14030 [Granulosicoccus sp.]